MGRHCRISDIIKQITEIVESEYDIGRVTDVYEILGGFTNRSFGVTVDKDGCSKTYIVRKHKYGITAEPLFCLPPAAYSLFTNSCKGKINIPGTPRI